MDDKTLFIDTNVLVYANVIEAPMHEQSLAAINAAHQAGRTLWISRQVIREYLVTMSRPQVFDVLAGVWRRFNWVIHAYCLITNQYHLLVEAPDGNLAKGMRKFNGVL